MSDLPDVLSFDPSRKQNWQLMIDCAELGFFNGPGPVIDVTYNTGRFWDRGAEGLRPPPEHRFDLDPAMGCNVADFRDLPHMAGSVGTVVLDAPYKLSGTTSGKGPSKLDATYDVEVYRSVADIRKLLFDGTTEAGRVLGTGGRALVKCQAQQNGSRLRDQPGEVAQHAIDTGMFKVVGYMHVASGMRGQPLEQKTPRSNYSTLVVLERIGKAWK